LYFLGYNYGNRFTRVQNVDRYFGIIGLIFILGLSYLMSNNKKAISVKTVVNGLLLQILLAVFVLKVPFGQMIFE
jgi:CNT family concentrative nucleoside transporter